MEINNITEEIESKLDEAVGTVAFTTDSILVSYDHNPGKDIAVLVVGRKEPNTSVTIINAFQGEEAKELYKKLTTVKKGE
jgi:hypothetical protein